MYRSADGALSLDLGNFGDTGGGGDQPSGQATPLADLLASLARPVGSDRDQRDSWFAQLRAVHVRDAHVAMVDRQLGVTWQAPRANIDLTRLAVGGVDGTAELELLLGEQHAHLALSAKLSTDARETDVRARITPVVPSVLARAAPSLAFLSVLDAPVDADAAVMLDAGLGLREARFSVHVGTGTVRIGPSDVPFVDAALVASSNSNTLTVQTLRVSLLGHQGGAATHIEVPRYGGTRSGSYDRCADGWSRSGGFFRCSSLLAGRCRGWCAGMAAGEHHRRHRAERACHGWTGGDL